MEAYNTRMLALCQGNELWKTGGIYSFLPTYMHMYSSSKYKTHVHSVPGWGITGGWLVLSSMQK